MSTERKYVGGDYYASPTEQTATSAAPMANSAANSPQTPDKRQRQFYEAQTNLLELVDEFMFEETLSGPIELLNDLLYRWLTDPSIDGTLPDMQNEGNREQLYKAFNLVNFLAKAYELQVTIDQCKAKEMING